MAIKTVYVVTNMQSVYRAVNGTGPAVTFIGARADDAADVRTALDIMSKEPVRYVRFEPDTIQITWSNEYLPFREGPVEIPDIVRQLAQLIGWRVLSDDERRAYRFDTSLGSDTKWMYWEAGGVLKPTDQSKIKVLSATPIIGGEFQLVPVTLDELYP